MSVPARPFEVDLEALEGLSDAELEQAHSDLRAFRESVEANPLWSFLPHRGEQEYREKHGIPLTGKESRGQVEFLELTPKGVFLGAVVAGNRFGKCLRDDQLVRMANGTTKRIGDIRAGEWVVGVNLDGTTRPARVLEVIDQGEKDVFEHVFAKRGDRASFVATGDHKMLARPESGGNRILPAGQVRERWVAQRQLGFDVAGSADPNAEHAMLVGLLLGDGYTAGRVPQFTCADPDILALAEAEAAKLGCHLTRNKANPIQYRITRPMAQRSNVLLGNPVQALIHDTAINCLAASKRIPAAAHDWPNTAVARLIAGLILTDGTVTTTGGVGRIGFCSVSRPLVAGVKALLEQRFGVYGAKIHRAQREGRSDEYSLWVSNYASVVRFAESIPLVGCKRDRLEAIVADWPGKKSDGAGLIFRERWPAGRAHCMDLVIDHPTHLFALANGLVVSNTHINIVDALIQTLPYELVPPWLHVYKVKDPAQREVLIRFIGPDLDRWLERAVLRKLQDLVPKPALQGGKFFGKGGAWNARTHVLTFADGSSWDFLTHDMELDAFASVELDRACFDEEPTGIAGERIYDETIRGLADREGDIRFTLTPVEGIGWLFSELSDDEGEPRQDDETYVIQGDIDHNPHLSEKGKAPLLKRWEKSGEIDQRKRGLWKHREGLIFPEYHRRMESGPLDEAPGGHLRADRQLRDTQDEGAAGHHHRRPTDERGDWIVPVFEAIDPGINVDHPFAFLVAFLNTTQTDPYGREDVLEVFHAFKTPETIVSEQADYIKNFRAALGYKPQFTVIDPAAKNRNPETGRKLQEAFRREGIHTVLGQNDRALTYAEIRGRLVDHRLRVWTTADKTLGDEFANYRWKRASGRTEDVARPEPIKRNDDLIDTLRYMVLRIPIWRGGSPLGPEESDDPRRRLVRENLKQLRSRARKRGRTGGVW